MDKILLVRPNKELESEAIEFKNEYFQNGENEINGSELWDKTDNYHIWLERISKNISTETVTPNWVVTDTFFAIREYDNKLIGIIDFRHELNDFLIDFGHCGYSVRPSERKKGYATEMLKQVIQIARNNGLKEIQLSCEKINIPSVKTIIKNAGIYKRSFNYNGNIADVFIIKL
jgi:predicted acetyltransferase